MNKSEAAAASSPILRVFLFGEFFLERLIPGTDSGEAEARYERVAHEEATFFYWQARKQWPREARIIELAELFIHDGQHGGVMA